MVTLRAARQAYIEKFLAASVVVLDSFPFAATIADPEQQDCPIIWVNDYFCKLTKYNREEIIGRNCRFLQKSGEFDTQMLKYAINKKNSVTQNIVNYKKNGDRFDNLLHIKCINLDQTHLFVGSQDECLFSESDYENMSGIAKNHNTAIRNSRKNILDTWCLLLENHMKKIIRHNTMPTLSNNEKSYSVAHHSRRLDHTNHQE